MYKMDFPTVNRVAAFNDSLTMSGNAIGVFSKYLEKLGSTYYFPFGGIKKALVTTDPLITEHVLQKNYKNYCKSEIQNKKMGEFIGEGLLTSHGPYWLTQRRIIQEGFKRDKLKTYLHGMEMIVERNTQKIDQDTVKNFDLATFLTHVTFEMVMGSLFTERIDEDDLKQIANTIITVQQYILDQIVQPYLTPFTKISGEYSRHQKNRELSDHIILALIRKRKRDTIASDMLDILLKAKYAETGEGMTEDQVLKESMQLIVAGHETSSTALLWIFFLLSQHSEVYHKVKTELNSIDEITMEKLMTLSYTLQVINESLRLYPPFWMVDRQAIADDEIAGHKIKKGTTVLVYIYGIHHTEKLWQQPHTFNPERFCSTNPKKEAPFTYLPFGAGPKGCIGGNYATLQILIILKKLFARFDITLMKTKVKLKPLIILKPKEKLLFNLTARA